MNSSNAFFWKENAEVSKLELNNNKFNIYYDTSNPVHALLYLSVLSGAFMGIVAPNKEWAVRHGIPAYIALEKDEDLNEEEDVTKSDAHAALADLRKNDSQEALFILSIIQRLYPLFQISLTPQRMMAW